MNFSFLSPLFLIGLSAVALPVIAHLISRKSGVKIKFSAVSFLLSSQGELAKKSRIKDFLLLVLRSLILVFLVLVFSKPAVFSFSSVDLKGSKSVAILVDNSYSMSYGDNFKTAKKKAEDLIDSLSDGSFGAVLPLVSNDSPKFEITQDKGKMKTDLKNVKLSYSFADNKRRVEEIFGRLQKTPNRDKEVILVTDLQKNGWKDQNISREWFTPLDVYSVPGVSNHYISQVDFEEQKESIKIEVKVRNYSQTAVNNLLTTVSLGDQKINGFLDVPAQGVEMKEFIFPKGKLLNSEITGKAETSHDKLTVDDVGYFVIPLAEELWVLIVDGDPREDARLSETYYIGRAVETISEIIPLNIVIKDNDAFLDDELGKYNMLLLANVGEMTPGHSLRIEKFLRDGGTVVIFPGDRVKSTVYNALFEALPAKLGAVKESNYFLGIKYSSDYSSKSEEKYVRIEAKKLLDLAPYKDSQVILKASEGFPLLVKKDSANGSIFLFAISADTDWSNFPLTPVFLPSIKEIFNISNYTQSKRRNFVVGDSVEIDFQKKDNMANIKTPSGETFKVTEKNPKFDKTDIPGIYIVEGSENILFQFSVNTDPNESDLEKISFETVPAGNDQETRLIKVFKEIWIYFLWGVIALFITESLIRIKN